MASTRSDARPDPAASIGTLSAMALPLLFFIAALPPHAYFGAHARLIDEAVGLSHAGTPVASLLAAVVARLPLGPLSLRVGLAVAVCAAIAGGALFAALLRIVRALGVQRDEVATPLCLGGCCVALANEPLWSLVLGGSPHVLGLALSCLLLERLLAAMQSGGQDGGQDSGQDSRQEGGATAWMGAALWLGLLASHDPAWALATLPGAWWAQRHARPPAMAAVLLAVGMTPMLHPLLRGAADAAALDAATAMGEATALHGALAVGALLGTAGTMRSEAARPLTGVLVLSLAPPGATALLGIGSGALAHAGHALLLLLLLSLTTLGIAALVAGDGAPSPSPRLPVVVVLVWLGLGVVQLRHASNARALSTFDTSDVLQQHAADHLPPRAVVLWPDAMRYADAAGHAREARTRPDVVHVPMSHARDPRASMALSQRTPALRALLRDQLLHGGLRVSALQSLAIDMPVAVDVDAAELPQLCDTLVPSGALLEVVSDGATRRDQDMAAEAQALYYRRMYESIELHRLGKPSRRLLRRLHRRDALYYMHFGDRAAALTALEHADRLQPGDPDIAKLVAALGPQDGPQWDEPIDIAQLVED